MKKSGATATEIVDFLKECLEPEFGHAMLRFRGPHLGQQDGVLILYNSVPKGTTGVAVDNAFSDPKFSIFAAAGQKWPVGEPAPAKVKVENFAGSVHKGKSFRGERVPFRAKTGTPEQVVEYLIRFFMQNKEDMLP